MQPHQVAQGPAGCQHHAYAKHSGGVGGADWGAHSRRTVPGCLLSAMPGIEAEHAQASAVPGRTGSSGGATRAYPRKSVAELQWAGRTQAEQQLLPQALPQLQHVNLCCNKLLQLAAHFLLHWPSMEVALDLQT